MEAKVGDRVSLDAKKVGQARRSGVVRGVTQGLAGVRLEIEWDGGGTSVIAPRAGILLVEGKAKKSKAKGKAKAKAKAAAKAKKSAKKGR
jgi:hypothetical protein